MERVSDLQEAVRRSTVKEEFGGEPSGSSSSVREAPDGEAAKPQDGAVDFRPVHRAPMAVLTILDDGRRDRGQSVRIRDDRTVIGRVEGDVIIPHDNGISGQHAEIVRELTDGEFRWWLKDLGSRNGTFVRVAKARLNHNQDLLIGAKRYRFDAAPQGAETHAADEGEDEAAGGTRPWQAVSPADLSKLIPSLIELTPQGEGERHLLDKPENLIGGDAAQCNVVLSDDPFVSALHAKLFRDDRNRWTITNCESRNGVWLKVDGAPMSDDGEFQLGEQRFMLKVL